MLPSDFCSLGVEGMFEDAFNLLQFQGIHDVYNLGQDFIDGRHLGRWSINSRQVAHSVLHHMRVVADENVESSPTADGLVFFGV